MRIEAFTQKGYELLHEGILELSRVEATGIRIDINRLHKTQEEGNKKLRALKSDLEKGDIWRTWRRRFGDKSNIGSRSQLGTILFKEMGFHRVEKLTEAGEDSTDDEVLQQVDHPWVSKLADYYRFDKGLGTFVSGIERELVGERLHPVFNLHLVRSFRSSSDSPNFQNFPVRNKDIAELIRSLFVPSAYSVLSENDFKGIEVGVSACYHKDEVFIDYIMTAGKDMHRDMAAQIYKADPSEISKETRYGAKNKFVFPQFYGDYYVACAKNLWEWAIKGDLKVGDVSMIDHLRSQGIKELGDCNPDEKPRKGTFEKHLQEVENDFWNNRFRGYGQWRKDTFKEYMRRGYFDLYTGFRIHGVHNRKVVTNYPIQGSAFHCLLWSLIQINRDLRRYKMKSRIVGQIHDSLIGDVRTKELRDYLEIVENVTTVRLRKHMDWLIVPLEIEYEMTPSAEGHGNWHQKREIKFKNGQFKHPLKDKWTRDPIRFVRLLDSLNKN